MKIINDVIPNLKETIKEHPYRTLKVHHHAFLSHPIVENSGHCSKFTDNPSYWNIHQISFDLETDIPAHHELFWETLANSLAKL
jgi:hypothetical protein